MIALWEMKKWVKKSDKNSRNKMRINCRSAFEAVWYFFTEISLSFKCFKFYRNENKQLGI